MQSRKPSGRATFLTQMLHTLYSLGNGANPGGGFLLIANLNCSCRYSEAPFRLSRLKGP
jgi:hypothetical protein